MKKVIYLALCGLTLALAGCGTIRSNWNGWADQGTNAWHHSNGQPWAGPTTNHLAH